MKKNQPTRETNKSLKVILTFKEARGDKKGGAGAPPLGRVTFVFFLTRFLTMALFRDPPRWFLLFVLCRPPPPSPPGHLLLELASSQDTGEVTQTEDAQGRAGGVALLPLLSPPSLRPPGFLRSPGFRVQGPGSSTLPRGAARAPSPQP